MKPQKPFHAIFPDGSSGEIPIKPKTRTEKFLGKIADNPNAPNISPKTRKERLFNEIWKAMEEIGTNLAPNYDPTSTYEIGDFCRKDGVFYICASAISEAEEFNPEHWTQTTIAESIVKASQDIDTNAVHYSAEEKTDAAKTAARTNIGAAAASDVTKLNAKRKIVFINDWVPDSYLESAPYDISWFFPAVESGDFVVDKRGHLGVVVSVDSDNNLVTVRGAGEGPVSLTNEPTVEVIDNTTTPSIIAADNTIYQCGELTSLTVSSSPVTGQYSIVFTSGATATTTTFPSTILGLEDFAAEANTMYEINVLDNRAVVGKWAVSSS